MGKAKKMRSTSHKKKASPTGGPTPAELEQYAGMPRDQAEMFHGVRAHEYARDRRQGRFV
ncbi:hypothetical protein PINS_up003626 [Pythium insidiosum]|nr:hypothetical protein PINS_up003626 [Pythium insidiosum]